MKDTTNHQAKNTTMIEIETKDWPIDFWYKVIEGCMTTYNAGDWQHTWFWQDNYSLYLSEENIILFMLRWS